MKFKDATDKLLASISHHELAESLGVSVPTVRQARLRADAKAHRTAPAGWEAKVATLADRQAKRFANLAAALKGQK